MITSAKNTSTCGSIAKSSTNPTPLTPLPSEPEATPLSLFPLSPSSSSSSASIKTTNSPLLLPGRIRSSSSCPYLPILGGLSGPASPAEVTKEIAFGGVVDNSGKFSPRIIESEGGYFALRNTAVAVATTATTSAPGTTANTVTVLCDRDRDREPASPRRITSSTAAASLVAAGTSGTIITRDCGWGEMVTGIESEGVGTVHHHHYFYQQRRTSSGNFETPEELLVRVKTKTSSSNLSFQQIHHHHHHHHSPTTPIQRSSSSLSLSFTPTSTTAVASNTTIRTTTSAFIGPPPLSSGSSTSSNIPTAAATSSVTKTTATPSAPRTNTKASSKSSLRLPLPPLPLPPPPKGQLDALGIGVQHILLPYQHPHSRFFPNTPDGRAYERRRESAPGLLVPGIHPRAGDWLLTPPEEVGGMLWHCPTTPSDNIEEMADRQAEVEGEGAKNAKYANRPATSDGTGVHAAHIRGVPLRKEQLTGPGPEILKEKAGKVNKIVEEEEEQMKREEESLPQLYEDESWGVGEEWLRRAVEATISILRPAGVTQEAVRILSYTLPCPLPTLPDPAYMSVGASTASTHQGRLPLSAASAPAVAAAAGEQLSPAMTARCNSKYPNAGTVPIGSRDGVTTTIHTVTSAIQRRYGRGGTNRVYINVSHAIPPHIPLNRLPSIPPPVSGPINSNGVGEFENPFGGGVTTDSGGYFAPTVFNSIVVAMPGTPGPRPPGFPAMTNPILPPNSLHLSILERFIPPNCVADDANMFSPSASILVDRLVELNDNGGTLLFIYPTKKGARQFVKNTLGPVLDPLLRKLMVLYGLREDLLWRIRNMSAVEGMADWDDLKLRVEKLTQSLSKAGLPVKVAHAEPARVRLNDESWREWWSQQEQMRIREIVKRHFANMPPLPEKTVQSYDTGVGSAGTTTPAVSTAGGSSFPFPKTSGAGQEGKGEETWKKATAGTRTPEPAVSGLSGSGVTGSSSSAPRKRESAREPPPNSIDLSSSQFLSQTFVAPLSPEASAHYLGIRSPNLNSSPGPNPYPTTQNPTSISPSNSSGGFTMGYGAPGDLAREVLDGVRALAVRPSSKGMGEAVMASALAGSGGNTAVGQGMGGVVGEAVGRKEGAIKRDRYANKGGSVGSWEQQNPEAGMVEVGVFVLRRIRRT